MREIKGISRFRIKIGRSIFPMLEYLSSQYTRLEELTTRYSVHKPIKMLKIQDCIQYCNTYI